MKRFVPILLIALFALSIVALAAQRSAAQAQDEIYVIMQTTQGDIQLKLYPDVAPKAVENFVGHVRNGFYNGLIFHRCIPNFMIQGGDPTGTGRGGASIWGGKFADEVNPSVTFSRPGLLAMANAGPNTNGSQFFITTVPTPWLNGKHTIFGEVVNGITVVKALESVPTAQGNRPVQRQEIFNAYVVE